MFIVNSYQQIYFTQNICACMTSSILSYLFLHFLLLLQNYVYHDINLNIHLGFKQIRKNTLTEYSRCF